METWKSVIGILTPTKTIVPSFLLLASGIIEPPLAISFKVLVVPPSLKTNSKYNLWSFKKVKKNHLAIYEKKLSAIDA